MAKKSTGIKTIEITASTTYPIVSAYEFETLKDEDVIRDRMKKSTIYLILQRPLMCFDNLRTEGHTIRFDIVDTVHEPLHCELDLPLCKLAKTNETITLEAMYYKRTPDTKQPFKDVAGFKIFREDGTFAVWETPQKLLYEAIANHLPVTIDGNVEDYLEYTVHYIGKAFSLKVWQRLTGHETAQKILTLENTLATGNTLPSSEIALLMLEIVGLKENMIAGPWESLIPKGKEPIPHDLDTDENAERFASTWLDLSAAELTSEVEAILVSTFKPAYNERLFENYPNISKGTRSAGYTDSTLTIEKLPVILKTAHYRQELLGVGTILQSAEVPADFRQAPPAAKQRQNKAPEG